MIIVDGPDGAGKTTLCTKLAKDGLVRGILESPGRTKGNLSLIEQTLRYLTAYIDRDLVVDRYLFSEMVYGPILRKQCAFRHNDFFSILSTLILYNNPIIFCLPENETKLNLTLRQMPGVEENIKAIFDKYFIYYEQAKRFYQGVFRYDLNDQSSYVKLGEFLNERKRLPKPDSRWQGSLENHLRSSI